MKANKILKIIILLSLISYETFAAETYIKNIGNRIIISNEKSLPSISQEGKNLYITTKNKLNPQNIKINSNLFKISKVKGNKLHIILYSEDYRSKKFVADNFVGFDIVKSNKKPEEKPTNIQQSLAASNKIEEIKNPAISETIKQNTPKPQEELTPKNYIKIIKENNKEIVNFIWSDATSAAAFKRGNNGYIIFNETKNYPEIPNNFFHNKLSSIQIKSDNGYTLYSFKSTYNFNVTRISPQHWSIEFEELPSRTNYNATNLREVNRNSNDQILYPISGYSSQIIANDSVIGDKLIIFTVNNDAFSQTDYVNNVDFDLIPTILGFVLVQKNDNLKVFAENKNVIIDSPSSKRITDNFITSESFFDFSFWEIPKSQKTTYSKQLQDLIKNLNNAPQREKSQKRVDIAKFYLKHGLAIESLAQLNIIKDNLQQIKNNEEYKILYAVNNFLKRDYISAKNEFNNIKLSEIHPKFHREIKTWIAASNIILDSDYKDNKIDFLSNIDSFMKKYPKELLSMLGIIEIEQNIEHKDYDSSLAIINILSEKASNKYKDDIYFYQGISLLNTPSMSDKGISILSEISKNDIDPKNRMRALFEMIKYDVENNKISKQEALTKLEDIMLVWRGDLTEAKLLDYYANLCFDIGNNAEGLRKWRQLVSSFSNTPIGISTVTKMSTKFVDIFSNNSNISDFESLALFFEFRELTPIGKPGDAIVRKIINKAISLDLLDQAEALLDHQVKYRSSGIEKNKIIMELAYIQLQNNKPEESLKTLKINTDVPYSREEEKNIAYLKSKALFDTKNYDEAIAVLSDDISDEANLMRADIYWKLGNWPMVKSETNDKIARWSGNSDKLTSTQQQIVIKSAIAYEMLGDDGAVNEMHKTFYNRMDPNSFARKTMDFLVKSDEKINLSEIDRSLNTDLISGYIKNFMDNNQNKR